MDIFDDSGLLRGQDYDDAEIDLPICVGALRALSAAQISRLWAEGGTIPNDDDEPQDTRQAIDRMLWVKRREQERGQPEAYHRWF